MICTVFKKASNTLNNTYLCPSRLHSDFSLNTKTGCAPKDAPCKNPHTISKAGSSPVLGIRKTVFEKWHGNCPVRIGYEYQARPRKHQVPCLHRQGVGYGAFCISGTCTPLARCNTLDFVPKSCAKGAAPLRIPAHIACGRCGFAA